MNNYRMVNVDISLDDGKIEIREMRILDMNITIEELNELIKRIKKVK